jgi:hypothetical protein
MNWIVPITSILEVTKTTFGILFLRLISHSQGNDRVLNDLKIHNKWFTMNFFLWFFRHSLALLLNQGLTFSCPLGCREEAHWLNEKWFSIFHTHLTILGWTFYSLSIGSSVIAVGGIYSLWWGSVRTNII